MRGNFEARDFIIKLSHEAARLRPNSEEWINRVRALKIALEGISGEDYQFLKVGLKSAIVTAMIFHAESFQ